MSYKNYMGHKAYQKAISEGKSKTEAKKASKNTKAVIDESYRNPSVLKEISSKSNKSYNECGYDFDSDLNGNGTNWHTSEDL